jgi:hypothetical protein
MKKKCGNCNYYENDKLVGVCSLTNRYTVSTAFACGNWEWRYKTPSIVGIAIAFCCLVGIIKYTFC